jgi:3-oxoacyl-[acyl-carrier protein] reductase
MLNGKVVVITGAASGIGRHLVDRMDQMDCRIMATDVNADAMDAHAEQAGWSQNTIRRKLDVRDSDQWKNILDETVQAWGQLDIMMNIAGFAIQGFAHDMPLKHIDLHLDINAKGAILGTHFAAAQMVKQGSGHIINMGSLAGMAPVPGTSLYSASKFALRGFSLAAARELRPLGVYLTYVAPDLVDTPKLITQLHHDRNAAAVGFSAPRILTVDDISRVVLGKVIKKKPLEAAIPGHRGALCKIGGMFPGLTSSLFKFMAKQGLESMDRETAKRPDVASQETPDEWLEKSS